MKADAAGGKRRGTTSQSRDEELIKLQVQQEANRKEEELQEQLLREKHRFLVDRLRADIRYFIHALPEFADPPPEAGQHRTWPQCIKEMEKNMNSQDGVLDASGSIPPGVNSVVLHPIVTLLNYRDRVLSCILMGALYQKALLDDEVQLASGAAQETGNPMAELQELVHALRAKCKTDAPEKYQLKELPSAQDPGHFTYQPKKQQGEPGDPQAGAAGEQQSAFQTRMLVALREMQSLDRHLRQMKFGKKVSVSGGKSIASDEMRKEIAKVFDKCCRLEHELQMSKAQRHAALDVQVDLHTRKCEEADKEIKKNKDKAMRLESDVQSIKVESAAIRREKGELAEKNQKMANEHLPVLDKLDKHLAVLRDAVDQLTADAEMLSQMFRLQVQDNQKITEERDEKARELARVSRVLRSEKLKNQLKDVELGKKETLYLRTQEARQATQESYKEGKTLIKEAEDRMRQKEVEWQQTKQEVEHRSMKIFSLKEDMRRVTTTVDELEQQKKELMKEFKAATGRPYAMLLEQYKVAKPEAVPFGQRSGTFE